MKISVLIEIILESGKTIREVWNTGYIDQMTITAIPVLTGSGIPLFGPTNQEMLKVELQPTGLCNIGIK